MKQLIFKNVLIIFLFFPILLIAQEFQGKAYYQTKTKVDLKMEDSHMDENQMDMMQEMLRKQFEKIVCVIF